MNYRKYYLSSVGQLLVAEYPDRFGMPVWKRVYPKVVGLRDPRLNDPESKADLYRLKPLENSDSFFGLAWKNWRR